MKPAKTWLYHLFLLLAVLNLVLNQGLYEEPPIAGSRSLNNIPPHYLSTISAIIILIWIAYLLFRKKLQNAQ
ncbi:MAG: hypothetical protein J7497_17385, partial [Chitinophagaceae bacterium]|nr:hypothetical protein [Chitinophagaceae bacterium]